MISPYNGYLIENRPVQKPMNMGGTPNDIPSAVLITVWETRIIDPVTGRTMVVRDEMDAKQLIDGWALEGNPEELAKKEADILVKQEALEELSIKNSAKIRELDDEVAKASKELRDLKYTVANRRFQ